MDGNNMNYEEYLDDLIEGDCSNLTIEDYRSTYRRFFFTYDKLNEANVRAYLAGRKASTKRKNHTQLKALADFFRIDIDWKRIRLPKIRHEAPLTITEQHERRILDYIDSRDHKSSKMLLFLLETGLRIGELLNLCPEHYKTIEDVGGKVYHVLHINTNMQTHSADGRFVPLSVTARHIIEEFGLPFNVDRRRLNDLLIECRNRLKLPEYKIHSFRKTFTTRSLASGVEVTAVANTLGHRNLSTILEYADRGAITLCKAFEKVA
jgi:integrase